MPILRCYKLIITLTFDITEETHKITEQILNVHKLHSTVLWLLMQCSAVCSNCRPGFKQLSTQTLTFEDVAGSHVWISRGFYRTTLQTLVGCSVCIWLMCHFVYMWQCSWPRFPFDASLSVRALLQPLATHKIKNRKKKPSMNLHTKLLRSIYPRIWKNWLQDRCFSTNQSKIAKYKFEKDLRKETLLIILINVIITTMQRHCG